MTISEKIKQSACPGTFTLYKEGMFYKCYNEDAMLFSRHIKAYQISAKHVKSAGSSALGLGIPNDIKIHGSKTQTSVFQGIKRWYNIQDIVTEKRQNHDLPEQTLLQVSGPLCTTRSQAAS